MIKEISRENAEAQFHIFPDIKLYSSMETNCEHPFVEIETYIEVKGYLTHLRKIYDLKRKLNYVELMQFVDSLQINVNRVKKHFDPNNLDDITDSNVLAIHKIIE
jgi:hypothetical protein